jgi:enediyne biosynthesis protein E5
MSQPAKAHALGDAPHTKAKFKIDPRFIAPMLITCVLLAAQLTAGVFENYLNILLSIATGIVTEIVCGLIVDKKMPHLASAYVSGISVGIILQTATGIHWPYAVCAMLSIMSKYVIRVKGRHPWNPSNFGISAVLLLAPQIVTALSIQWGNNLYAMGVIWLLGSMIIANLKRFHICLTYVVSFVLFAALRAAILHDGFLTEVAPITGPPYQLFVFFMITDPKSTVHPRWAQMLVAFLVAAMECTLRFVHNVTLFGHPAYFDVHAAYYALFIVGPIAVLTEIWLTERKKAAGSTGPKSTAPAAA